MKAEANCRRRLESNDCEDSEEEIKISQASHSSYELCSCCMGAIEMTSRSPYISTVKYELEMKLQLWTYAALN